jgi:hypothetical protein
MYSCLIDYFFIAVDNTSKPSSPSKELEEQPSCRLSDEKESNKEGNEPPRISREKSGKTFSVVKEVLGHESEAGAPLTSGSSDEGFVQPRPSSAEQITQDATFEELYGGLGIPDDDISTLPEGVFSDSNVQEFLDSYTVANPSDTLPDMALDEDNLTARTDMARDIMPSSPKRKLGEHEGGANKKAKITPTGALLFLNTSYIFIYPYTYTHHFVFFFLVDSFSEKSKKIYESIAQECKEHYESVEGKLSQNPTSSAAARDIRSLPLSSEFSKENPVDLRGLTDSPSAHCLNYVQADLKHLRRLLNEYPVNKASVSSAITHILKFWEKFFDDPPSEVARLMKGLIALQKAYQHDPSDLATTVASHKEQVQQRACVVKTIITKVAAACDSMDSITAAFEGQLAEQERIREGNLSRAKDIEAQIEVLRTELWMLRENISVEDSLKAQSASALSDHHERVKQTVSFKTSLEKLSSKDDDYLRELDQINKDFVETDELGLSRHMYALHDFVVACASQED